MDDLFEPAIHPPTTGTEPALWFAFQGDRLLVQRQGDRWQIPICVDFAELQVPERERHYLGTTTGTHCYAVDLDDDAETTDGCAFHGLRQLIGQFDERHFWIGGRAVQIVAWSRTHKYCGQCGKPMQDHERERARQCPACGLLSFPRLSPAIIVMVERDGQILLARSPRFPAGRYSVLAGFVEPGESLEEAVVREIREEVSIEVKNLRYFGSQPWPFPNSLMLGFTCEYASGEIKPEPEEIEDAGWYRPDKLPDLPDGISISRRLIDWFLAKHALPKQQES